MHFGKCLKYVFKKPHVFQSKINWFRRERKKRGEKRSKLGRRVGFNALVKSLGERKSMARERAQSVKGIGRGSYPELSVTLSVSAQNRPYVSK